MGRKGLKRKSSVIDVKGKAITKILFNFKEGGLDCLSTQCIQHHDTPNDMENNCVPVKG